ncbi:transport and Golgi organization protein 1 homolog isoform X2 [Dasypus novemcinctus]|uniref:transport and Golgi organization protein 1 homolog isoform X2 n=1 Tax=Dasypus novemcinctus TaxID=9361 RepID=UPI0039C98B3B
MPTVCKLQEYKKKLEADCSLLRAAIAAKEQQHKTLQLKVESYGEIFEKQRMAAEEILKLKAREEEESQARLSEVEEKVNTAAKEVQNYKQKIKAMAEKLQAAECSFREQIAPHEKAAHDTWLKAHALERALVQQAREAEYLK